MGLYTLICTNGVVLPKRFGYAKIKPRAEMNLESVTATFKNKIDNMLDKKDLIVEWFDKAAELPLPYYKTAGITKSVSRITSQEEMMELFGIDDDTRIDIKKKGKDEEYQAEDSPFKAYETYYNISKFANDFKGLTRRQLQQLAGRMISAELLN